MNFSPTEPKAFPRKGRRGAHGTSTEDLLSSVSGNLSSVEIHDEPVAPPRSRKTGVWSDESVKSVKERLRSPDSKKSDHDDDIPLIPDIEEINDGISSDQESPVESTNLVSRPVPELRSDPRKKLAVSILDDINLGILTRFLYPEPDLKENDSSWLWDLIFTEVSSELRMEKDNFQ